MVLNSKYKMIVFNLLGGISIFLILVSLRLPILLNANRLLSPDESMMASEILELYNGGPFSFYYSLTTYFGIFNGLAAIPFFEILGVGALAFKLPATLFYALFILSSYWLAKKINPKAALIVVLLMIFTSPAVWSLSSLNYGIGLICFLGNLIFLSFIKVKETNNSKVLYTFLLGFFSGFAIYSFTYSIVYIGSAVVLLFLSNNYWTIFRDKVSIKVAVSWFTQKKSGMHKFIGILDVIILFFIPIVLFSYIFGGFGIDIARYSILQSNELHKPVEQLLVLITIRIFLFRQDIKGKFNSVKRLVLSVDPLIMRSSLFGLLGFVIGIFPRIWSISKGEITKGGQGMDVDFVPSNLANHIWQLTTHFLPELLGLRQPIAQMFNGEIHFVHLFNVLLSVMIFFLLSKSMFFFAAPRWDEIKNIFKLKPLVFNPAQFLLILPILTCAAVIVSQGPPAVRYLFPLHGVVCIWTAIYLEKVRHETKTFTVIALLVWCIFSTVGIYKDYLKKGIVKNLSIIEKPHPYVNILDFCKKNKISHAYSDYYTSNLGTFLSKGEVKIAEYNKNILLKKMKESLGKEKIFAIIVDGNKNDLPVYQKYLNENLESYSENVVKDKNEPNHLYHIFSNIKGSPKAIDQLRSLIVN
jgi:hypothetical protein